MGLLNPEDYVEGGLYLDDVDVDITSARFELWDYNGGVDTPVPALHIVFTGEDGEGRDQYFSFGSADKFIPSDDGLRLVPVGDRAQVNKSCNGAIFLSSLTDEGFDGEAFDNGIDCLDGVRVHVVQQDAPERKGFSNVDKNGRQKTVTVVDGILDKPTKRGRGAKKPAAKKTAKKGKKASVDIEALAQQGIVDALESNDGELARTDIPAEIMELYKESAHKNKILTMAYKEAFLSDEERPWAYDPDEETISTIDEGEE